MEQTVSFTVTQINDMLAALGDMPAKLSMGLIAFIRETAEEQLKQPEAPMVSDVDADAVVAE